MDRTHHRNPTDPWTRDRTGLSHLLSLLVLAVAIVVPSLPAAQPAREYQIKAVFLFNFAQFVEWPETAFADTDTPISIGVLGDDPFGADLDEVVRNEMVRGRPLNVRRYRAVEEIESCHVLFISASESHQLERIFDSLRSRSVLTVGDAHRFAERGGMIRFATQRNKIRLHINLGVATSAQLKLSSMLLRPAEIITTGSK